MSYELHREIIVAGGSASAQHNNISSYYHDGRQLSYAAIAHNQQVNTVSWDARLEGFTNNTLHIKEPSNGNHLTVIQVKYLWVRVRAAPLIVVATIEGFMIFEVDGRQPLSWQTCVKADNGGERKLVQYCKGIGLVSSNVCVGNSNGEVHVVNVTENALKVRPKLTEHKGCAVVDVAAGAKNDILVSIDMNGVIVVYDDKLAVKSRLSTGHTTITALAVMRTHLICTSVLGLVHIYHIENGQLLIDVAAHARCITGLAIAYDTKLFATVSEDSFVRVWKLSQKTKEPESTELTCVYSYSITDAPLTGVCFNDHPGTSFCVSAYDYANVFYFKKCNKPDKTDE